MSTVATLSTPRKSTRIQPWQAAWRHGFAPQFSARALELLARGLVLDDPAIIQGATTRPPPLPVADGWDIEGADPVAYCIWQSEGLHTVGEVETAWAMAMHRADELSPHAAGELASWWDETPRREARLALLQELNRSLRRAV